MQKFSNTFGVSFILCAAGRRRDVYRNRQRYRGGPYTEFAANRPVAGLYNITYLGGPWGQGYVRFNINNGGTRWYLVGGKVYVMQ